MYIVVYLIVILICIYLVTKDIQHVFMYCFAIYISSLKKGLYIFPIVYRVPFVCIYVQVIQIKHLQEA